MRRGRDGKARRRKVRGAAPGPAKGREALGTGGVQVFRIIAVPALSGRRIGHSARGQTVGLEFAVFCHSAGRGGLIGLQAVQKFTTPQAGSKGSEMAQGAKQSTDTEIADYYKNIRREIEPLIPNDVKSILEIGCGSGATMAWLRSIRPIDYAAGVELFPDAAKLALRTFDAVEIADLADARFEFAKDQFDAVMALDILEHLPDPGSIVRRLRHKIRPGGYFIASVPNISHYQVSLPLFFRGTWEYQDDGLLDRTHLHFFTEKSASDLFTEADFSIVKRDIVWRTPSLFGLANHPSREIRWYAKRLSESLFRWPHHLFAFQFLITARIA